MIQTAAPDAVSGESLELHIHAPRALTSKEELAFSRAAAARNPESHTLRYMLATQLNLANLFEEAIAVLRSDPLDDYGFLILEADARMSREEAGENLVAKELCMRALELTDSEEKKAAALAMLSKVYIRLGEPEKGLACAEEALALDVHGKDAFKRLVAIELKHQAPENVLALVEKILGSGVFHSRVLSAQGLALARLGRIEEARVAMGAEAFSRTLLPAPPEGWATLEAFTGELAAELGSHPDMRFNRYGTASAQTWRIDEPSLKRTAVFPALQRMISREVQAYLAALPEGSHPFLTGRPTVATLRNWCVITEGDGHETWHVHQNGWLSGVFYVYVPEHIAQGTGKEGCIAFGIPEDIVGEENAQRYGETLVRPVTGLMRLFPSHVYHRTYPHHGEGRRICCAFDIIPATAETVGQGARFGA